MEKKDTLMGILYYVGFFVLVPLFTVKDDPFVSFHIKQGLVLLIIEFVLWVFASLFLWHIWFLYQLLNLAVFVFSVIGIINVLQGKEEELPFIGPLAKSFKI